MTITVDPSNLHTASFPLKTPDCRLPSLPSSPPPKNHTLHTLPLPSPEPKNRILHPPTPLQLPTTSLKPPRQLLLRPIAARNNQHAPLPHQPFNPSPIPLTHPPPPPVRLATKAHGVKSALVKHDVEARLRPGGRRRGVQDIPFHKPHTAFFSSSSSSSFSSFLLRPRANALLGRQPPTQLHAPAGVIRADHASPEAALVPEQEQHLAGAGAEVQERGRGPVEVEARRGGGEVVEDLAGGVDVFEPCLAGVGRGGGVGGQVVGVGRVPAGELC